ncbi:MULTISPECIES: type 2 periplasmic-binding domain-containing protein [Nocardia]|uniref:hypothetical protein n=1 Tax=Nocardia TaxID=1817 RepID=UPI0024574DC8|nr:MULTISPECIES: hypothetical protein [Nocardia]
MTLTSLGKQLRDELRPAYDQISASVTAASRGHKRTITVGFSAPARESGGGGDRSVRHPLPDAVVDVEEIQLTDPFGRMRSGAVDLQLPEFPIAEPDITTGAIMFSEPRALMVSEKHPFAARESVCMEACQPRRRRQHRLFARGTVPLPPRHRVRSLP